MSAPLAKYPASVWDRTTLARGNDPTIDREPSFKDWDQAVDELIAVENHIVGGVDTTLASGVANGSVAVNFTFNIPNTAADYDIKVGFKIAVTGVTVIKKGGTGGASDTITVKNLATAISDAMALNTVAAKSIVRNAQIDTAQWLIAAGGTLRVTAGKTTDCSCEVIVHALASL